ncbi:hypothetical protein FQA39_LY01846 [Lamprigera yunnana]|nr:hypothetical protein FQA39_LY01846 [Lamprigera yunnana]
MFKLAVIFALIAVSSAGIISHGHVGAIIAHQAPAAIAIAPISAYHGHATSYANHNSLSIHPVPIAIAHHAPIVHGGFAQHGYYH